jgi:hypothetical protein
MVTNHQEDRAKRVQNRLPEDVLRGWLVQPEISDSCCKCEGSGQSYAFQPTSSSLLCLVFCGSRIERNRAKPDVCTV